MKGWITINTDAGFYPMEKVGSYAYWIKGDGVFYKGSGLFKDKCKNSTDAEKKAIINALHVVEASRIKVEKIIINRDNIYAKAGKKGDDLERMMSSIIRRIKLFSIDFSHKNYTGSYVEFRHVKAHKHTNTPKHWVNQWCDDQCKMQLRKYRSEILEKSKP